jgi:hypothetical protein
LCMLTAMNGFNVSSDEGSLDSVPKRLLFLVKWSIQRLKEGTIINEKVLFLLTRLQMCL